MGCGKPMARLQQECGACGWERPAQTPKSHTRSTYRDYLNEKLPEDLAEAECECKRFRLSPQAPGESPQEFCARINREKTPLVAERNLSISRGLDYWREKHKLPAPTLPLSLQKLLTRWMPREPGSDDEFEGSRT